VLLLQGYAPKVITPPAHLPVCIVDFPIDDGTCAPPKPVVPPVVVRAVAAPRTPAPVVLLVGAETAVLDESSYARSLTLVGNAARTTAQAKFGTASITFDGSGDRVTTGDAAELNFGAGDFTVEGWFRLTGKADSQALMGQWDNAGFLSNCSWYLYVVGGSLMLRLAVGGTFDTGNAWSPTLGQWYHVAADRQGTTIRVYVNGAVLATSLFFSSTVTDSTAALVLGAIGDTAGFPSFDFNGQMDEVRITVGLAQYAGAFTPPTAPFPRDPVGVLASVAPAALQLTGRAPTALRLASGLVPVAPALLQLTGRAPTLTTLGGTVPPNTTPATALDLGTLPVSLSLDVSGAPGPTHDVWFTYTAPTPLAAYTVGWFASMVGQSVVTLVFTGPVDALVNYNGASAPMQLPVTAGVTYYFQVTTATPTAPLVLSLVAGPNVASPLGALVINDDATGFPIAILSPTTGEVLQYRPFLAGETGAVLVGGPSLWEDVEDLAALHLFDATLTEIAAPAWPRPYANQAIGSNRVSRFYVAVDNEEGDGPALVTTIDATGAFGPTTWHLPNTTVRAIEPSRDETILYYLRDFGGQVHRWDLVADAALSDLAPAVTDYQPYGQWGREFLVLSDGSIIVPYMKLPGVGLITSFVRRYSPAGAILNTYDLGRLKVNRVAYDGLDAPGAFWIWSYLLEETTNTPTNDCRFHYVRVSDGVILQTFDTHTVAEGVYVGAADPATLPPGARFGHAGSCPFYALPYALPPWGADVPPEPEFCHAVCIVDFPIDPGTCAPPTPVVPLVVATPRPPRAGRRGPPGWKRRRD
jgi:hypothetical protein